MEAAHSKSRNACTIVQYPERHERVFSDFPFHDDDCSNQGPATQDEAENDGQRPRVLDAAHLQAEQQDDSLSYHGGTANPIYSFDAFPKWGFRDMYVELE
jgi:hypothetical protein